MIEFRTLGAISLKDDVRVGEIASVLTQPKRVALLAYLAIAHPRGFHRRSTVLPLFWPEKDERHARWALNSALRSLRRGLGRGAVHSRGADEVGLDRQVISCDAVAFEAACAEQRWETALELYGGDLLQGLYISGCAEFERWVEGERVRLRGLAARAAWALTDQLEAAGEIVAAAEAARRGMELDPHDETGVRHLIELLDRAGDRAGAVQTYEEYAQRLREVLDVEPAPETQALIAAVRARTVAPGAQRPEAALHESPADRFETSEAIDVAVDSVVHPGGAREDGHPRDHPRVVYRSRLLALGVVAVVAALAITWWSWRERAPRVAVNPNVVAVLPFRVTAPDTLSNYLREGVVDLLSAWLTGDGVPRAVDSRTMLSAWRRAVNNEGGELSTEQALDLGQRVGASQVLLGEIVRTPSRATISARLLGVPAGGLRAEGSESGSGDELELIQRLVVRMLAHATEGAARASSMSDSLSALKAYLAGARADRRGEPANAVRHYEQALAIDSAFALAALRLALLYDNRVPCLECLRRTALRAWSLRDRLGTGDRALMLTLAAIGPKYPDPSTWADLIAAAERAAAANPDSWEAWFRSGLWLLYWGPSAGVAGWLPRAVTALDSSLALDTTAAAAQLRLHAAIHAEEPQEIRRFAALYSRIAPGGDWEDIERWWVARTLNDSAALSSLRAQYSQFSPRSVRFIVEVSAGRGFSLDEAERAVTARFGGPGALPEWRCMRLMKLMEISMLRGRVDNAIVLADSASRITGCATANLTAPEAMITIALVESGYAAAAREYARQFDVVADTAGVAEPACYAELWRVARGDTSRTRRRVRRIRQLVQGVDPAPLPRVGRLEVCALFLEAALEWMQVGPNPSPALDRLESLLRQGAGWEVPTNVALLMVARWRARQGDYAAARAMASGPFGTNNPRHAMVVPAYRREEGRLAAVLGDTAGAIRAYQHYLMLRDDPDPGSKASEVDSVKVHLAQLIGDRP
jgi:serine/threonine-protein kinase